jgi:hypothetical protein
LKDFELPIRIPNTNPIVVLGDISTLMPIELDMQYSTMKKDEGSLAQST